MSNRIRLRPFVSLLRVLLAITLLCLLPGRPLAYAEYPPIAIIGDTHVGLSTSIYPTFIKLIEKEGISVVIHLGDVVDNGRSASQWASFLEITGTGKTVHLVEGNHDASGRRHVEAFEKLFSKPYYAFVEGDTLFVLLDTELPGERATISGAQFQWLEEELLRPFRYKFVFLHRPLFSIVPGHGLDANRPARDRLHDLFVRRGVTAVFSGHDHVYNKTVHDGVTYVIASGGGGPLYFSAANGGFYHYLVCTRSGNGYTFSLKDTKGETQDQFFVGK